MFYVKVLGSQPRWFAVLPERTRLFITDSANWEEGASAKAASSASFFSPDIAPFSPLLSRLSPLASEIISLDMTVSIWRRGLPRKKKNTPTHSLRLIV